MQFIHEFDSNDLFSLLLKTPWNIANQSLTSKDTNGYAPKEPSQFMLEIGENTSGVEAFCDIPFHPSVKQILDVGGGQFDANKFFMASKGIELSVWDPYNRTYEHNKKIEKWVADSKGLKVVTSMSVLNVIPELEARISHINTVKSALKQNGLAFFKIWPGESTLKGSYVPSWDSSSFQANAYQDRFFHEVEIVFGRKNVSVSSSIPNLIIAKKTNNYCTPVWEIDSIKKSEKKYFINKDMPKKNQFMSMHNEKLLAHSQMFFKRCYKSYLIENRHKDAKFQLEYDKQYAVIPYKN